MLKASQVLREKVVEVVAEARSAGKVPNLRYSDLTGADLSLLDLHGVDFTRAVLTEVDFEQSNLEGAIMVRAALYATLLYKTHMKNANLTRVEMKDARFLCVTLAGADLSETYLSEATTNFDGADLRGIKLFGTNLTSVDLTGANLEGAEYSPDTVWPDGFDYEAAVMVEVEEEKHEKGLWPKRWGTKKSDDTDIKEESDGLWPFEVHFSDGAALVVMAQDEIHAENIGREERTDSNIVLRASTLTEEEKEERPAGFYSPIKL